MKIKEKITGIFTGIFIMLILCTGIKAKALYEEVQVDYSSDGIYKYETGCEYYGILADVSEFDEDEKNQFQNCIKPEMNTDSLRGEIFTGKVQFSERLNYIYNYTEEDNIYIFNAFYGYENYDINYLMINAFFVSNQNDAENYLEKLLTAYKISDNVYEYSHTVRIYMRYTHDIQDIYSLSESILSISDVQVDSNGAIYYDIQFDESLDYYSIKEITEKFRDFEWYDDVSDTEFLYNLISSSGRIIAEKPKNYDFEDWNETADTTTTSSSSSENSAVVTTTTVAEPTAPATTETTSCGISETKPNTTIPVFVTTTTSATTTILATTTTAPSNTDELTGSETAPSPEYENTPDINQDGQINIADAVIIKKVLEGNIKISSYYINISDVNNDGVIDELDYMTVYSSIMGYGDNIKSVTVNINSVSRKYADCYVKIMSNSDLSDMNGKIFLQKNIFGKYIDIIVNDIDAEGFYYIFSEKYIADSGKRYRLVADILYDSRKISVLDSCMI